MVKRNTLMLWLGATSAHIFHSFVITVIQALTKLHQLYAINEYGTYAVSNNVELMNNHVWMNVVPLPHHTDCPDELDASVQGVFFDSQFKVWDEAQRVTKNAGLKPPSKQVLRKS